MHGMRKNHQLKIVVLADNKVGDETITLLAGRVRGNISHLCKSLLTSMQSNHSVLLIIHFDVIR